MLDVWIWEFVKGGGRMFTLPFLYIAIIMIMILSMKRIKKERATFGTRVFERFSEWKGTWAVSLIAGLCLSIFTVGGGMVLSFPFLLMAAVIIIMFSLSGKLNWYSPAYTLGGAYLVLLLLPYIPGEWQDYPWMTTLQETPLAAIAALLGFFMLVEAILMLKTPPTQTFPERTKGSRGMWIGQHRGRKMAIVPFFALVPGGSIEPFADWWPLFSIAGESFGLILVPFLLGWEWVVRGQAPEQAAKTLGRHTFLLALLVLALSIGSFFVEILSLAAVVVSLLGREMIHILHRMREEKPPFFSSNPKGVRILGVIPGSPAAQMGMIPGELIERVNGMTVRSETQFYEALQQTGAFNKIEVRDEWGENRYLQRAMYEGEHYELGLVFVEPPTHEASVGFF
ncbi:PDZ domain-containing protein [Halobacillus litoralis]|uniref:PDZ domain-containing protein n=1 Tax=Halobacillus litoralis TaxID=45668 RepID=UPI0024920425|nr:PDZ domain-containing protein [Halobacillus litoralis]